MDDGKRVNDLSGCAQMRLLKHRPNHVLLRSWPLFDGDIHDAGEGLHKWAQEHSQPIIEAGVTEQNTLTFTCVRNPYTRILSSFNCNLRVDLSY